MVSLPEIDPKPGPGQPVSVVRQTFGLQRYALVAACGALVLAASFFLVDLAAMAAVASGLTLLALAGFLGAQQLLETRMLGVQRQGFVRLLGQDQHPAYLSTDQGALLAQNSAASTFAPQASGSVAEVLGTFLTNPDKTLARLLDAIAETGQVTQNISTQRGGLRVSVHAAGQGSLVWRFEKLAERSSGRTAESLPVPMLTAGRSGAILFMNEAARTLAGGRIKTLRDLFGEAPVRSGEVNQLLGEDGARDVTVIEQETQAGRREMFLLPTPGPQSRSVDDIDGLPVPVMKLSVDGHMHSLNASARTLLGKTPETGDTLSAYMSGLGRPLGDWLRDVATGRLVKQTEFLRLTRRDQEMFAQVTLSRVQDEDGVAILAVMHDATELKTLEAQFVQTQKMQAIGQLAGGVAHDFNNLLTAISGHCDLLLLRHDQGDPDYADLIQIRQNANRAAALVGQLLAFSRKQTLRPEVLDLRDTLADLTHLLNRLVGEKVTLTLIHDPLLGTIRADKRQLEQVLMNLVVNARDAMPAGGEIRIETEVAHLDQPLRRDRARVPEGAYVIVRVIDQGEGIEPEKQSKIFEPFYTTKRTGEGTGLGLSTAYGIVKQTGGFIFVDSDVGKGSCFTLYLPVVNEDLPQKDSEPQIQPQHGARAGEGVVLLVEDEAPVRAFASRALRLRGYTVLEAESAEDALTMLSDPSVAVDVFVTDVVMPGMNGPTWVRKALKDRPNVRVVFVSGYSEGAFDNDGPAVPNSTFLPKPFSLSQLTETVNRQMH